MTRPLVISEVFGPTVQGEGPSAGRRCAFVRLGRCNLDCRWCDTPYTWDWTGKNGTTYDPAHALMKAPVEAVANMVKEQGVTMAVITGGEPMLQRGGLDALVMALHERGIDHIEIETNGTQPPWESLSARVDFNVSPKLTNSGCEEWRRYNPAALDDFVQCTNAIFKFVCVNPDDLIEVDALARAHRIDADRIWIMPEGVDADAVTNRRALVQAAIDAGYNFTTRLHVALWGNERGR